jgi:hypothetical protein
LTTTVSPRFHIGILGNCHEEFGLDVELAAANVSGAQSTPEIRRRYILKSLELQHRVDPRRPTGLKIEIGRTTVASILAEEGIEPAPERDEGGRNPR